jgi:hypothetical protein
MKKLFNHLLITILFAVVLSSCDKDKDNDDSPNSSNIIGTWEYKGNQEWGYLLYRITFHSNFTGNDFCEETYEGEKYSESDDFTWSVTGNNLTIVYDEDNYLFTSKYTVSGNHLTITSDEGEKMVFLKK